MNTKRASAQLPVFSDEWVAAHLREDPNDKVALYWKLRYELPKSNVVTRKPKI